MLTVKITNIRYNAKGAEKNLKSVKNWYYPQKARTIKPLYG